MKLGAASRYLVEDQGLSLRALEKEGRLCERLGSNTATRTKQRAFYVCLGTPFCALFLMSQRARSIAPAWDGMT